MELDLVHFLIQNMELLFSENLIFLCEHSVASEEGNGLAIIPTKFLCFSYKNNC